MDVSLHDSKKARKIAAAVSLLKQQEMAILAVTRPYENPMEVLNVIRKDQFDLFLKTVNLSLSTNQTEATVCRVVNETMYDILATANTYIKFPSTIQEIEALENGFSAKTDYLGNNRKIPCFGCFDGKHWATEHPPNSGSVNNDAQLTKEGPLPGMLEEVRGYADCRLLDDDITVMPRFLLADNGFKLTKSVMEPYRKTQLTTENVLFNKKLSAVRVRTENLFGVLTSKFQVFDRSLKLAPENAQALIVALMIVHNVQLGPLLVDNSQPSVVAYPDPYKTPEEMRTALKNYVLNN
ncbi:Protein CBG22589 [Caenorhabditis briggsae]|uniref:Protein CBG22589 n=1 Tax=Caenorhabditis briggsae TaxID=6238 RepID=A8Y2L5_CAEBR|nr:Protein CBG22589 [Caenorhabditis briggsae]CAP39139.2 Protein CBG22589 [Caenorhabditis briggsae]